MSLSSRAQLGVVAESTYGTPVTVTRFYEFLTEDLRLNPGRIVSAGLRSGHRTIRNDRAIPHRGMGAGGQISFDVMTKGFGLLLQHCLGTIATAGPTDAKYTHTATEGPLLGRMLTVQSNRPFHPADTDQAFTYHGAKVMSWELVQETGDGPAGTLKLNVTLDCEDEDTSTGLASASYTTATLPFGWPHLGVTIGGSSVPVKRFKVACNNKISGGDTRAYARGSDLKQEPVETELRDWTWELVADFSDLTQKNRVTSLFSAATGLYAQIIATWTQTVLIGAATFPTIVATIPAARFDAGLPAVDSRNPLQPTYSGVCAYDGTNSPVSIAYGSADVTP